MPIKPHRKRISLATRAVRAASALYGDERSIAPPIFLSTTFERDPEGEYSGGFIYSREDNPNRRQLEHALTDLEDGADAAAFASGSAAAMTLFQALRPGDHVVVAEDSYYSIRVMLDEVFVPWGLSVTYADCADLNAVEAALAPETRLVFIETPSNPLLRITDITGVAALAHAAGAIVACDNTLPTPVLQQPLAHGADLVVHATTKYLAGNHDVMGGALVTARADDFWKRVRAQQKLCGAIPSPFASWLTLRGITSLVQRVRWQNESALALAEFLATHPAVREVLHPGLPTHPGHALAAQQSSGSGGLFSFRVNGDADDTLRVAARLRLFRRATSFGGPDSLVEHRASVEGTASKTPGDLLRLAAGLEDAGDLIADLQQALDAG
ncbi:MAG: aminotransferase class V-fold PLP-dependent enzyme [Candidatus Eremiobacteraeota bacterium]|nr:aminotransferase class V-fold PLP-dependent enzyme [Candidatus Eremiobacteraeota bacterium]